MDKRSVMSGIIEGSEGMFFRDGYRVTLMPRKLPLNEDITSFAPENKYLHATSFRGKKCAFFIGNRPYEICGDLDLTTPVFIESCMPFLSNDLHHFSVIQFSGGSLNLLRKQHLSLPQYSKDDNSQVSFSRPLEKREYTMSVLGKKCTVTIGMTARDSGNDLTWSFNSILYLSLSFEEMQTLDTIWYDYQQVNRLISVMTNRMDNHFDEISIFTVPVEDESFYSRKAIVNIRDNDEGHVREFPGISFSDLGESAVRILELFYNSKEKKPSYSLGFIPRNEEERWRVTDDIIRAVASAIECELAFYDDITSEQQEAIECLCTEVKALIKAHRETHKDNPILSDRTYDQMFGSINHWSMTAAEKMFWLYQRFSDAMEDTSHRSSLSEADIQAFVKYRNSITHGTYRELDSDVMRTTIALEKLVICSLLERVGVPHSTIIELAHKKIGR